MTLTLDLCKRLCEKEPEKFFIRGRCLYYRKSLVTIFYFKDTGEIYPEMCEITQDSCDRLCRELGWEYQVHKENTGWWYEAWRISSPSGEIEIGGKGGESKLPASIAAVAEIVKRKVQSTPHDPHS